MSEFKVGESVRRCSGTHMLMHVGNLATIKRICGSTVELNEYDGQHSISNLRRCENKEVQVSNPIIIGHQHTEAIMKKVSVTPIIKPTQKIKKMIFLYDNGKEFHATKITHFNHDSQDIRSVRCIQYATREGAHFVYRDDLAAITFICEDGYQTVQKLKGKVTIENGVARMYKKVNKTRPTEGK